ncbi:uncharacterized protein Z520_08261 [Fonsecaea multimorphosa CBS 102226]|uniref:Uncharacterized protein n=1 Tax=Fonsecaea multimorphosa CBS 102226 TaxID=1442371 RepID=A0A0D2IG19_9EURO|nr:uncharacterized protein Z520_08261 [Fonsecaea multimorphosa CBS 102226]KIX96006.1 hypothetical protein Z520_08261 [Fonsecaea multimorphosa CBS 102226]
MGSCSDTSSPVMPEDIAVVGLSCRFSGGATDPSKFWDLLYERRSGYSKVPSDRFNVDAFHHASGEKAHTLRTAGGHFLQCDPAEFDAPFFGITSNEAKAIDPAARMLLEVTYEAFENAGLPTESLKGSDTSCYVGCFTRDFHEMQMRDAEASATYAVTGTGFSLLSNRVSWFFDLRGPSLTLDTACSSSLVGLHLACQGLRSRESTVAVVSGTNLILSPDLSIFLGNLGMLSKDGLSRAFADGTTGYGRGEGIATLILKRVSDAVRDGDSIRAVIRGSGVNQDGHTKGITVPNSEAQASLIRSTYQAAGLDLHETGYFEAHGTGTAVGDPLELAAVAKTVAGSRRDGKLYIGSVKSNIGHTEGAAGIAGVIKSILMLEHDTILPNIHFERPNPRIPFDDWNMVVPIQPIPWPSGSKKRVSVNSFGYGGTNAHVIIDSAAEYLSSRGITKLPSLGNTRKQMLFLFSAQSKPALERMQTVYQTYLATHPSQKNQPIKESSEYLERLAFTLGGRRSQFEWQAYAIGSSLEEVNENIGTTTFMPVHASSKPQLNFIFTGQGAQWARMGIELLRYPVFRDSAVAADRFMKDKLGCKWSVIEEMQRDELTSKVSFAEFSQPLCSVLQVALVDLLASWGINPVGVVGHSSGEIGAAYACGALTAQDAWTIAYFRGQFCSDMSRDLKLRGSMMAVGCSRGAAEKYVAKVTRGRLVVACVNSPESMTISGDEPAIDEMLETLKAESVFARKLKVENAYHSHHMELIASKYLYSISHIKPKNSAAASDQVVMASSVTGNIIQHADLGPEYWVKNLVSPVLFSDAVSVMLTNVKRRRRAQTAQPTARFLLELGPHAALQGPVRQILSTLTAQVKNVTYKSVISRGKDACITAVDAAGSLFTHGVPVSIHIVNGITSSHEPLKDLPSYPWNRAVKYWSEPRQSKEYRLREHGRHDLLGAPVIGFDKHSNLRWRNFLRQKDNPWMKDHVVSGTVVYPAAGILAMPIEALRQIADKDRTVESIQLKDVRIGKAIVVPDTAYGLESVLCLHKRMDGWFDFSVQTCEENEDLVENATGVVGICYQRESVPSDERWSKDKDFVTEALRNEYALCKGTCNNHVEPAAFYLQTDQIGLSYGPSFQALASIAIGSQYRCHWELSIPDTKAAMPAQTQSDHLIHPTTLDVLIHSLFAALGGNNTFQIEKAALPVAFDSITVAATMINDPGTQLHGFSRARNAAPDMVVAEVFAWSDGGKDTPCVQIRGMQCKELPGGRSSGSAKSDKGDLKAPCAVPVLKPDLDLCNRPDLIKFVRSRASWQELASATESTDGDCEQQGTLEAGVCKIVDLLAHKNPELAMLQVGGSSSTLVSSLLAVLTTGPADGGRFTRLTVADADLDDVKLMESQYNEWKPKVNFVPLRLDLDAAEQGLHDDSFDLIVVTPDQAPYLQGGSLLNIVMGLLREQGKLVVMESVWGDPFAATPPSPTSRRRRSSAASGASMRNRRRPSVSSLESTIEIPFGDDEESFDEALSITTKPVPETELTQLETIYVLQPANAGAEVTELCELTCGRLVASGLPAQIVSWPPNVKDLESKVVLCLLEVEESILMDISATDFDVLRKIVLQSSSLVWVANGLNPTTGVALGYLRSIKSENLNLQMRYLLIKDDTCGAAELAAAITKVATNISLEREYHLVNGQLCISRLVPEGKISQMLSHEIRPRQYETMRLEDSKIGLRLVQGQSDKVKSFAFTANNEVLLSADEVEVEIKAISVNHQSKQASQQSMKDIGGIVKAVGKDCSRLMIGDPVFGCYVGEYGTTCRTKEILCHRLPSGTSFAEAAAWPTPFAVAYRSLHGIHPVREGQSVLIQGAASAVGQAALQLASSSNVTVFATAKSADDSRLIENLGVESAHVLDENASDLELLTLEINPRKFDMILITSSLGDKLSQLCRSLAPNGVLFNVTGSTGLELATIDAKPFEMGCTFSTINIEQLVKGNPAVMAEMLAKLAGLMADTIMQPINPLIQFSADCVADAFEFEEQRSDIGRVVLMFKPRDLITVFPSVIHPLVLSAEATYVVVGGLGGLGRSITRLLVEHGAKHLALLSRSGPRSPNAIVLVDELGKAGVVTKVYACDVSDKIAMTKVIADCTAELPPIKGVIQSASVLQDSIYENMTHDQWSTSIRPKVHGSMLLHELLPEDMDFFVMLSSISGIVGNRGQANYAAGNTFEDALAHWRLSQGLPAVAIDLGLMVGIGMIAERGGYTTIRKSDAAELDEDDFRAILRAAISGYYGATPIGAQLIVGIPSGGTLKQAGLDEPFYYDDPRFALLKRYDTEKVSGGDSSGTASADQIEMKLAQCTSLPEAARLISGALCETLARGLQTTIENIDYAKPLHTYGVDSLMAVEIRTWVSQKLKAEITLFEVLSGGTIAMLAAKIASSSKLVPGGLDPTARRASLEAFSLRRGSV